MNWNWHRIVLITFSFFSLSLSAPAELIHENITGTINTRIKNSAVPREQLTKSDSDYYYDELNNDDDDRQMFQIITSFEPAGALTFNSSRRFSFHREKRQSLDYNLDGYSLGCQLTLHMFPSKIIKIMSPYHGRKQYPTGLNCEWEIIGQESCIPVIRCENIDLRNSTNEDECNKEHLTISDGALAKKQFCGPNLGFSIPLKAVLGEYLFVSFQSNADSTYFDRMYKGFYCRVNCHQSQSIPQEQNQLPLADPPKEEYKCLCGRRFNEGNNRVVNGETAKENEFPWQAALVSPGSRAPFCGGSLINDRFILTAAHCLLDESGNVLKAVEIGILLKGHILDQSFEANNKDVELGQEGSIRSPGWDLEDKPEHSKDDLLISVEEVIVHQLYNKFVPHEYDIALLRLTRSLPLARKDIPTPVCIPDPNNINADYTGKTATVSGWGKAHELAGATTRILQKLDVPVLSDTQCKEMYAENEIEITDCMFCAGFEEGVKDTCTGDSGGPLTIQDGQRHIQIGVVSFGTGCARKRSPGVYTRVTKFVPWIRHHTKGSIWPRYNA